MYKLYYIVALPALYIFKTGWHQEVMSNPPLSDFIDPETNLRRPALFFANPHGGMHGIYIYI